MKHFAALLLILLVSCSTSFAKKKQRPKILGIAYVEILTTHPEQAKEFYKALSSALLTDQTVCNWCESVPQSNLPQGPIRLAQVSGPPPSNLLGAIALETDNASGLREFLRKSKVPVSNLDRTSSDIRFTANDPEGHKLIFLQVTGLEDTLIAGTYRIPSTVGLPRLRLIHAGFIVKDREAMDHFYKDVLGFHLYWQGGMKNGETNWVDMQMPDGTAWIEYMLNVPADASSKERGVMNHIALGVVDMKVAEQQIMASRVPIRIDKPPQIGRDGKWQLNLYDPDETRIELMEYTPVEKPCCSDYTGPHPKP